MKPLHLDPRTKLLLILICALSAMFAPNLYFQFALTALIGLLAALCGRWRYALRGIFVYALICVFMVWCMGAVSGVWRTMFVAFLGLVHKVYACGMLAGLVISTTRVGEFLSAMARLHCPKKLSIASVTHGIENPKPRTCLVEIQMRASDWLTMAATAAYLALELAWKGAAV